MDKECSCCCNRTKKTPRSPEQIKSLKTRINRISGQLDGISKMIDDNRYCGDILIQVAACERALQEIGYLLLKDHLSSCVKEEIIQGNDSVIDEAMELMKRLK